MNFSVRESIRDGRREYPVTPNRLPAFLYEDPSSYDPEDIYHGLLRGEYLLKVRH